MHRVALELTPDGVLRLMVELVPETAPNRPVHETGVTTREAVRPLAKTRPVLRLLKAAGQ